MAKIHVTTTINGEEMEFLCEPQQTLLDTLRDEVGLTGTKEGCAEGECGACTVHMDGRAVLACLVPAAAADGCSVTTVEGLDSEVDQAIQERFVKLGAVQCGFCTPGFVMCASALVAEHGDMSPAEIRDGLSGNICRCTGYESIVESLLELPTVVAS